MTLKKSSNLASFNEFDVGAGELITVRSFLEKLKQRYDTDCNQTTTKLAFGTIPYRQGEMMRVEVNNKSLLALGWQPAISLDKGFDCILKEVV